MLGPSRVCSLDVDDVELTRQVLQQMLGLDVDALADAYPTSVGNPERFRVMFRVPEGVELTRRSDRRHHASLGHGQGEADEEVGFRSAGG
ncbi:bifunctional DNA primase/polymerase [Pseudomonas mosselii]|uniref:bifunctional DNA primase/polymerase n=1 Tax=Pseudomonas mosselii TaxID=78327 RepID=UPI0035CCF358